MARKTKRDVTAQIWNRPYLGQYAFLSKKKGTTGISDVDLVDLGHLERNLFFEVTPLGAGAGARSHRSHTILHGSGATKNS